MADLERKVEVILGALSPETKDLLDGKLRDLAAEKRRLQRRLEDLEAAPYEPIDVEAVVRDGMAALRDLPRLLGSASIEERKELVAAFVDHVTVLPDESIVELQMRTFPALPLTGNGNSSVGVVAGARHEPVQTKLRQVGAPRFEPVQTTFETHYPRRKTAFGTRHQPLQIRLGPPERFVLDRRGLKRCA